MPDAATGTAAVQAGEQDWQEAMPHDLMPVVATNKATRTAVLDPLGFTCQTRVNHRQPPFDNPAIRRALLGAIDQEGLRQALAPLAFTEGPEIVCETLREGPAGIETQEHVESVTLPLRRRIEAANDVDAFVIACYSDPGLHVAREGTASPVFGIAECGVLTALTRADRFGVIAIRSGWIPRHLRQMGRWGRWTGSPASARSKCRWRRAPRAKARCSA